MINFYKEYIEPKEIVKDINFIFNELSNLIKNEIFAKFLYHKRKNNDKNIFVIKNYLSKYDKTRLRFKNDTITIKFITVESDLKSHIKDKSVNISDLILNKNRIDRLNIDLEIPLSLDELNNKMIYSNNIIFPDLRKKINFINDFYVDNYRKAEEKKFRSIYNKISMIKIDQNVYPLWFKLNSLIINSIDPSFDKNLSKLEEIIKAFDSNTINPIYKIIHQTQFYLKYSDKKQIKINKYINTLNKEFQNNKDNIIYISNQLAEGFGHSISTYEDSVKFIINIINHFNFISYKRSEKINKFVFDNWGSGN